MVMVDWARPRGEVRIERAVDRLDTPMPVALQVELTSRCNLRCRMCPLTTGTSSTSAEPGPMTEVLFDEFLQIARGCRRVILAGYGEPLTNPQCLPMLRALDAEDIDMSMATNAIALTPEVARQLVALRHLSLINISIDSPDPEVYRQVRGGNLDRAMQGLRNIMVAIDDPSRVRVSSVAMRITLPSLTRMPAVLAELGVRTFSLQSVMDYNDYATDESLLDHPEMAPALEEIRTSCDELGIELEVTVEERTYADVTDSERARRGFYGDGEWDKETTRLCHVPWDIPFIDKDGGVFPCCFAASANERRLGRLGEQTFHEIWLGEPARRFRRDIIDGRTTPDICRRCSVAPLGQHDYKLYATTILSASVTATGAVGTVRVVARNDGARTWTKDDMVRVANAAPRDVPSSISYPGWLSGIRAATFCEPTVPPGEIATFEFPVWIPRGTTVQAFELVADGHCWLPNSRLVVRLCGRRRRLRARAVAAVRNRPGRISLAVRRCVPGAVRRAIVRSVDERSHMQG
jgi:radical SAM protein with 4Fe4S-binding SPASM domain